MTTTRINLFGEFELELDGTRLEDRLRGVQSRLLVAYLVLHRHRPVRREELEVALWGDGALHSPAALAPPLSRLRRVIGVDRLEGRSELRLVLEDDARVDVELASTALEVARAALERGDDEAAFEHATGADEILAKGLLPGIEAVWLDLERERLQEVRVDTLELAATAGARLGRSHHAQAERAARAAVELAPFRESAWLALLDVLRARGNVAQALREFERIRTLLRDELGTVPGPDLLAAHQALLGPAPVPSPPPRPTAKVALTPLIGREREVVAVRDLLEQDDVRLVTLLGPGGIGKTRLAIEVAARLEPRFDVVCFVDLTRIRDPQLVASTIAWDLGLRGQGGQPVLQELEAFLRSRSVLLVLDNFEHVADAAPIVNELLASSGSLKVLATSRTVLRVRGERRHPVPALDDDEAVRLFVECATAAHPGFELTAANEADVIEICRRLDGMPLAIELAAVRTRMLPPKALLARLGDRFAVLTVGARDAPERQRTLRATIAWSYELLDEPERELFDHLGVFAGGFDLAAAETVVAGRCDVVEHLGSLVDKSLVRVEEREGEPRFSLLESLREYALEHLVERDEQDVRRRHALHYVSLADAAEPEMYGPEQVAWLERLEADHDNLRAALSWFLERDDVDPALRIGWGIWIMWWFNGHVEEGARWFLEMVARSRGLAAYPRARALSGAGLMALGLRDVDTAERTLAESLDLYREAADDPGIALAAGALGLIATMRCDLGAAETLLAESLEIYRRIDDEWFVSVMLNFSARIPLRRGDCDAAAAQFTEALEVARRVGDTLPLLLSLYNLAFTAYRFGDPDRAVELLTEGVGLATRVSDLGSLSVLLDALAVLADPVRAEQLREQAASLLADVGGGAWLAAYAADRLS